MGRLMVLGIAICIAIGTGYLSYQSGDRVWNPAGNIDLFD
jgi:hypothetical protein